MDVSADRGLNDEFLALARACGSKRLALFRRARKQDRWRRRLFVLSGVMTLVAGLIAAAIFADLLGSTVVKALTAILIFASGVISLIATVYANDRECESMFEGASEFLSVRDRAMFECNRSAASHKQLETALIDLKNEYAKKSSKFDRYLDDVDHDLRHYLSGTFRKE